MQGIRQDKDVSATLKPDHPFYFKLANLMGKPLGNLVFSNFRLNVDHMMSKACKKTGLKDFGQDTFLEGFEVLINSINNEANLTNVGEVAMHIILLNSLVVRLDVEEWIKKHPEALEERIEKPFMIAGLPRTGTTILSFLLEMDPENRSLMHWEAENPAPPPHLATVGEDPRITKCVKRLKLLEQVAPLFQTVHPMSATIPTECVMLFAHEFKNPFFSMLADMPSYLKWLKGTNVESAYEYHKQILQILQYSIPVETWSLKSPAHIFRLETLVKTYPDIRLIITHRDIQKVVPSTCSLIGCFRRGFSSQVNMDDIGEEVVSKFKDGLENLIDFDNKQQGKGLFHLQYYEFIKDPIEAVHEIYNHFDKQVSPLHEKKMRAWLKFNPQNKHGKHKYVLEDFGLTPEKVEEAFGHYRSRYNIPYSS